ncbi:MAG TPA: hypothetical protein VG820_13215 [Fimbriimonadaceae bacterium]|nr:hypothetical protein [Fimbriimonadaceae bacterium]
MLKFRSALLVLFVLSAITAFAGQAKRSIKVSGQFYRVATAIDTQSIKAIGSAQTKATPTILQVTPAEAARIAGIVKKGGGSLVGSPSVITNVDENAKISADLDGGSYTLDVTPSNKGSDTITLNFKLYLVSTSGNHRITRSAKGMARVQEAKALLIIVNPRDGQEGFMAIVRAAKTK